MINLHLVLNLIVIVRFSWYKSDGIGELTPQNTILAKEFIF